MFITAVSLVLHALALVATFLNLTKFKFTKISLGAFILGASILPYVLMVSVDNIEVSSIATNILFILIMTVMSFRKRRTLPLGLLFALLTDIICLLANNIAGIPFTFLFDRMLKQSRLEIIQDWQIIIPISILMFLLAYVISWWLGSFLNKKLESFPEAQKRQLSLYLLLGAILTFTLFIINIFLANLVADQVILNTTYAVLLIAYFVYLVFAIYTFTVNVQKDLELKHKEELLQNLHLYTDMVENTNQQMREYRHDQRNLLIGFHEYIQTGNLEGIRSYFEQSLAPYMKNMSVANAALDNLKNIQIPELKSILIMKLASAQALKIDVHVEVVAEIEAINFDIVDLCRVTGIFLDNATEACRGVTGAMIKFAAFKEDDAIHLLFINTCSAELPVNRLFEQEFSTKGEGRGMGLYTARRLINKCTNAALTTEVKDGSFIQQLIIA